MTDTASSSTRLRTATIDVVVPVYNEERSLAASVRRLRSFLDRAMPFDAVVTIADNASTDRTWEVATGLAGELDGVRALHLGAKGRGRALRAAWTASDAAVVCYMDVDLSTGLDALLPLVAPLVSGHSDLAIGSRLAPGARIVRGPKREVISHLYNLLLRLSLRSRFSDAQCGFKAMRAEDARAVLPFVRDQAWFFDTELLVLAERNGLRIHEVPVDWRDDPDSRVDIVRTALDDLKGVVRLGVQHLRGEDRIPDLVARRRERDAGDQTTCPGAKIGIGTIICYLTLFLALRMQVDAAVANISGLAGAFAAQGSAAALRRRTTGRRSFAGGPIDRPRWSRWPVVVGLYAIASIASLGLVTALGLTSPLGEAIALAGGAVLATVARSVAARAEAYDLYLARRVDATAGERHVGQHALASASASSSDDRPPAMLRLAPPLAEPSRARGD